MVRWIHKLICMPILICEHIRVKKYCLSQCFSVYLRISMGSCENTDYGQWFQWDLIVFISKNLPWCHCCWSTGHSLDHKGLQYRPNIGPKTQWKSKHKKDPSSTMYMYDTVFPMQRLTDTLYVYIFRILEPIRTNAEISANVHQNRVVFHLVLPSD